MPGEWDVVGNAPVQVQNPWAVKNVTPAPAGADAVVADDLVKGVGDAALSGISKVSTGIVGAPISLANRLIAAFSGGDSRLAADATHEYINREYGYDTQTPIGKKIGAAVQAILAPLGESAHNIEQLLEHGGEKVGIPKADTQNMTGEAGDIAGTAGIVAPIAAGAGASTEAAELAAQNAPAAVTKYGMQTGAENPVARNVAGASAKPAVTAHNQSIADPVLGAQAGVPVGTKISPASLEAGRVAPDSVYARAETSIPTGPLSQNAEAAVQGVGSDDMIVHSPDTQATIDAQKARLLSGPLTGSQVVNAQRALRFNGFHNVGSEDPEQMALGHAQLKMADALHQHMVDTLPPGAPVSADQLSAARVALAQNHTIENALGPNGNINLAKLAKIHNDNPGMLSGPMQEIAQFASDHPEVTKLPSDAERFNPSGVLKDVASIDLKRPLSYVQPFFGFGARRALTGPKPHLSPTVTGLGGEFAPLNRGPQAPTEPATPSGSTGGGLADLFTNNASDESAASQEAINRTSAEAPRFLVDPDGNMTSLKAEGAAVADYKPPKGSIVVQGGGPSGKPTIIDRGGLPESHANGLLNRALTRRKLGDEF